MKDSIDLYESNVNQRINVNMMAEFLSKYSVISFDVFDPLQLLLAGIGCTYYL